MPYYRPLLTEMIVGDVADDKLYLKAESFYSDNQINLHLSTSIESVTPNRSEIVLRGGEVKSYSKLLIATGATPFVPPIKGRECEGVFTLRDINNLETIREHLKSRGVKTATVIGGGLLGLEAACSLAQLDIRVTVIDTASFVLPRQTDSDGSALLQKVIENSKVEVITGAMVDSIAANSDGVVCRVNLADGREIFTQMVLLSVGLSPNISIAKKADINCDRAIIVNSRLETSVKGIYAAGDCAICDEKYNGVWEPAINQGVVAGSNMAGEPKEFSAKEYPATLNAFESSLLSIGNLHNDKKGKTKRLVTINELKGEYQALYFAENRLDGALLIGDISSAVNQNLTYEECIDKKILH